MQTKCYFWLYDCHESQAKSLRTAKIIFLFDICFKEIYLNFDIFEVHSFGLRTLQVYPVSSISPKYRVNSLGLRSIRKFLTMVAKLVKMLISTSLLHFRLRKSSRNHFTKLLLACPILHYLALSCLDCIIVYSKKPIAFVKPFILKRFPFLDLLQYYKKRFL